MRRWGRRGLLVFGALAVVFLALEGLCRASGVGKWDRTLMNSVNGSPFVHQGTADFPPPGTQFLWLGHEVRINPQGFRGDPPAAADASGLRVVAVGDSWTFGWGVGEEETLPARVEQALSTAVSPVRVYNLGVPGMDTEQEVRWLRRSGTALKPRVVILGFNLDDVIPADDPFLRDLNERQGDRSYDYVPWCARGGWFARFARVEHALTRYSNLWRWASDRYDRMIKERAFRHAMAAVAGDDPEYYAKHIRQCYAPGSESRRRWEAGLQDLLQICRDWNCGLVVVVFYPIDDLDYRSPKYVDLMRPIHEVLDGKPGVKLVDMLDHLEKRKYAEEEIRIPYDGHPLPWVYATLGRPVAEAVLEVSKGAAGK